MLDKKLLSAAALWGALSLGCGTDWLQSAAPSRQTRSPAPELRSVRSDASSEQIRQVQRRLNDLNYGAGPLDGKMGMRTRGALRDFQRARGLAPTGRLNDATLKALNIKTPGGQAPARTGRKPAAVHNAQMMEENLAEDSIRRTHHYPLEQQGLTTEGIRQVQQKLNEMGYDTGQADGQWGAQTQAAVRSFQQAKNIEVTGRLDNDTLNALGIGNSSRKAPGGASGPGGGSAKQENPSKPGR